MSTGNDYPLWLRAAAQMLRENDPTLRGVAATCNGAADEIATLQRELAEARAENDSKRDRITDLLLAAETLGSEVAHAKSCEVVMREALIRIRDGVPAFVDGRFCTLHFDGEGNELGFEDHDPEQSSSRCRALLTQPSPASLRQRERRLLNANAVVASAPLMKRLADTASQIQRRRVLIAMGTER